MVQDSFQQQPAKEKNPELLQFKKFKAWTKETSMT